MGFQTPENSLGLGNPSPALRKLICVAVDSFLGGVGCRDLGLRFWTWNRLEPTDQP
jgi:hypothetical protein